MIREQCRENQWPSTATSDTVFIVDGSTRSEVDISWTVIDLVSCQTSCAGLSSTVGEAANTSDWLP